MTSTMGCVYLVGAGCGESDLITLRGMSLLRRCDVVIYDDLIADTLLSIVPDNTEKIYMGKRLGKHSSTQAEICAALIAKAHEGKLVVRLKGGDPFVFGRGGEELLALQAAGIPCEEVPGISSAIGIPAFAGIPVTHRGISQSLHIITAHTADTADGLPSCFDTFARLPGTLVFLMGLSQLPLIAERLIGAGMPPDTPAAVVSGGNAPYPAAVRGALKNIAKSVRETGIRSPAVIIVGAVASMNISSTIEKPLSGLRIGLTGTDAVTQKLQPALQDMGAQVFQAERSIVHTLPLTFDMRSLCDGKPRWLVFTSSNGVRLFFQRLAQQELDLRRLHTCRFAVIGASTGAKLKTYGIQADLCPEVYTSEALAQALCNSADASEQILLFRSAKGSASLFRTLAAKYDVQDIPLYDLQSDSKIAERARSRLNQADYLTFSSAGGVDLFFEEHGAIPNHTVCVCIGAVTAKALRARYPKPFLIAPEISAHGILQAIKAAHESAK